MTEGTEVEAFERAVEARMEMFMVGLHALHVAIDCDDPKKELLVRIRDLIGEAAALPLITGREWQDISTKPERPVQVEFYYGNATMLDQNSAPVELPPYRDERRELGYWDGEDWHHCGTGHRVNEFGDDPPEFIPTHWRPLPAGPLLAEERTDG